MLYYRRILHKPYSTVINHYNRLGGQYVLLFLVGSSHYCWSCEVCRNLKVKKIRNCPIESIIDEYKVTIKSIVTLQRRAIF